MADVVGDVVEVDAEADHRRLVADGVHARERARDDRPGRGRRRSHVHPRGDGAVGRGVVEQASTAHVRLHERSTMCEPMKPPPPVTRTMARRYASGGPCSGRRPLRSENFTRGRRPVAHAAMWPDVVLPVLNEVDAIPWVLERMPAGYRPIIVDNGSTDGSGDIAAQPRRARGRRARAGVRRGVLRRALAATADVVCFMDCDGSLDPGQLPTVADPVGAGDGRPRARRTPRRARRLAGACTDRQRRARAAPAPHAGRRAARSRPDARRPREDLLALGIADRRFGWPLEMVLLAARADGGSKRCRSTTAHAWAARR